MNNQPLIMRNPAELRPHPDNPRGEIDPDAQEIVDLTDDIIRNGIIQPLVVTSKGWILAGHRRQIAAIKAGLAQVPTIERELSGSQFAEEIFLSENMHRQDLSPLEEARTIAAVKAKLEKQSKKSVAITDLARRLNLQKSMITQRLTILRLPERVQNLFHIGEIPLRSATQLARLVDWPDEIEKFADRMVTRQITFASLDALITRRMRDLNGQKDNDATLARDESLTRIARRYPENSHTPVLTRETVVENLGKKLQGSISMFNVKVVLDSVCCSCGMMGSQSVCLSCPLPRFVNGLIGRANNAGEEFEEDADR